MKQTVEEAAKQELTSSYAIIVEGELAYQRQAMLNICLLYTSDAADE